MNALIGASEKVLTARVPLLLPSTLTVHPQMMAAWSYEGAYQDTQWHWSMQKFTW